MVSRFKVAVVVASAALLAKADIGGLYEGQIVSIRNEGQGKRYLEGNVGKGTVSTNPKLVTGARWRVKVNTDKTVSFQSLGTGKPARWLDCKPSKNELGLYDRTGPGASGTSFSYEKISNDVGTLKCMSTDVAIFKDRVYVEGLSNGKVDLISVSRGQVSQWKVVTTNTPKPKPANNNNNNKNNNSGSNDMEKRIQEAAKKLMAEQNKKQDQDRKIQEAAQRLAAQRAQQTQQAAQRLAAQRAQQTQQAAAAEQAKKARQERLIQEAAKKMLAEQNKKKEQNRLVQEAAQKLAAQRAQQAAAAEQAEKAKQEILIQEAAKKMLAEQNQKKEQNRLIQEAAQKLAAQQTQQTAVNEQAKQAEEERLIQEAAQKLIASGQVPTM